MEESQRPAGELDWDEQVRFWCMGFCPHTH